jgi:hypothetical protein
MALYLIQKENGDYQEIMNIRCVVEVPKQRGSYRYEHKLVPEGVFAAFPIKDTYEFDSLDDICLLEDICKKNLVPLLIEQRDRKKKNHRTKTANVVMWSGNKKLFDLSEAFAKLWEVKDEEIEKKVEEMRLPLIGNGAVHKAMEKHGYLI